MNQREIDAVEKIIKILKAGGTLEDFSKQASDFSPEMREMLETASELMSLGNNQISNEQMKRSLSTVLSQAASLNTTNNREHRVSGFAMFGMRLREWLSGRGSLRPVFSRVALVFGVTLLFILLSGGLVIASAKSLPGDSLYPVKIAVEDITVYLVPSREIKQEYEVNYRQQRVDEVLRLITLNRVQTISFEGVLQEKGGSSWKVSGIPISIQTDTIFVGELKGTNPYVIGSLVEVEGTTNPQGGVTANEIHLRQYQFIGTVEKIDTNSWEISGVKISITSRTQIEEGIKVGDKVNVLIHSEDNGLYAISILSTEVPLTVQTVKPTIHEDISDMIDATERIEMDNHEAITTSDHETSDESNTSEHDGVQATPEPGDGSEHHSSTTGEPSDNHESESHEGESSTTPEHHGTPEPTESHGERP
jgi:hypothetical protein